MNNYVEDKTNQSILFKAVVGVDNKWRFSRESQAHEHVYQHLNGKQETEKKKTQRGLHFFFLCQICLQNI